MDCLRSPQNNSYALMRCLASQASQSGYGVDYVTQGAQGSFPGNFLNQNSQAGYSRFGTGNDFMSQVCSSSILVLAFCLHASFS